MECPDVGYPHWDAKHRVQYENSHYDSEAEAWERLEESVAAHMSLAAGQVEQRRKDLARVEAELVEAGLRQERMRRALDGWRARQKGGQGCG